MVLVPLFPAAVAVPAAVFANTSFNVNEVGKATEVLVRVMSWLLLHS